MRLSSFWGVGTRSRDEETEAGMSRRGPCLEMAKSGFELRSAGSKLTWFSTALHGAPPPRGQCGAVPISKASCPISVEHTFEKTPGTQAVATPKPGLPEQEPRPRCISAGGQLPLQQAKAPTCQTQRPWGMAHKAERHTVCRPARSGARGGQVSAAQTL